MNCKIIVVEIVVENFKREAKRLVKKYASLKEELFQLEKELLQNPRCGTSLGKNVYKIRLAVNPTAPTVVRCLQRQAMHAVSPVNRGFHAGSAC